MKQNKLVYQAPEAEIFEVKIDGGMLMASDPNRSRFNSPSSDYDNNNDLDEI